MDLQPPTATQIIAAHPYSVLVREDVRLDGPVLRHVPQEVDGEALDPLVLPGGDGQLAVLPKKPRNHAAWMTGCYKNLLGWNKVIYRAHVYLYIYISECVICRNICVCVILYIYIYVIINNHISYVFISSYILHHIPPTTSATGRYYNIRRIIGPTAIEIRWLSSEHGREVEADQKMINSSGEPWKKISRRNDQCTEPMIY